MNYLFELTHPKHYYQFKVVIRKLQGDTDNKVLVVARDKDVLLKILLEDKVPFAIYGSHGKSMFAKFFVLPNLLLTYYRIIKDNNIDIVISKASPYATILSKFTNIKTMITPDSEIVNITNRFVAPMANLVITPKNYLLDYGNNHKKINGFFEDCYLHPNVFKPNSNLVTKLGFSLSKPYFILRFISWNANHDINNYGFKTEEKIELVQILQSFGDVYISSEGALPDTLEKYRIKIPPTSIHHVLHYASLYIGDSQTMATEAALLGTPSLRYNSFVGENDMSNFILLENKYGLLKNFGSFEDLLTFTNNFFQGSNRKMEWGEKRNTYYKSVGDVNESIIKYLLELQEK